MCDGQSDSQVRDGQTDSQCVTDKLTLKCVTDRQSLSGVCDGQTDSQVVTVTYALLPLHQSHSCQLHTVTGQKFLRKFYVTVTVCNLHRAIQFA